MSHDSKHLGSSVTIAANAALLFVIQPIAAKALLPRFGGSASVWVTCMMFFQIVLLLGYLYSFWITRYPSPRVRTVVHLSLLVLSALLLPIRLTTEDGAAGNPVISIVLVLASSLGLPFFVLSTTSSLVQSWYAASVKPHLAYRLFALSNIACLLALLSYPLAIEPASATTTQLRVWSAGYVAVALLIAIGAIRNRTWESAGGIDEEEQASADRPLLWILLSACGSALWLSVSNYLSQEVAAIPFLWVLPLSLYLLSFALCFGAGEWYRPAVFRWLVPIAAVGIASRVGLAGTNGNLRINIPVLLAALLVLCVFCHGELVRTKPVRRQGLAFFYFLTATGGALGGIFVAVVAPALFSTYLELPIAVTATAFLSLVLLYGITSRGRLIRLGVLAAGAFLVASRFQNGSALVAAGRNFYGAMQIRDSGEGDLAVRTLFNGRTLHGVQFLAAARRSTPTAYYGRRSGVGRLMGAPAGASRSVAVVGLGAGTLAAYGRKGETFRFYEINPAVIEAASSDFKFLADSAATTDIVQGDGRLCLEREAPHSFNVIVLDAFSDDAIPVHLLTREAFQLYFRLLRDGGPLAIHITNRYLDLYPVVQALARSAGKSAMRIHSPADAEQQTLAADWVIVSDAKATGETGQIAPLWTDEYSNLFQVWR